MTSRKRNMTNNKITAYKLPILQHIHGMGNPEKAGIPYMGGACDQDKLETSGIIPEFQERFLNCTIRLSNLSILVLFIRGIPIPFLNIGK